METKVILPTFMRSYYEQREDDPTRLYEVKQYEKYEFTLEEALRYMIDNGQEYMFEDMILHNINMRNEMRKIGAKNLGEQLRSLVTPSNRLEREMRSFIEKWDGKTLGDIDIQVVPTRYPFEVGGIVIDGLDELLDSSRRVSLRQNGCLSEDDAKPEPDPKYFIKQLSEAYPRFDIYDSCDDRRYRNFLIRKRPITGQECGEVHRLARNNYCAVTEDTPTYLLPLVYYVGDGGFMLVAERHNPLK